MLLSRLILPFITSTPTATASRLIFLFPGNAEEIACQQAISSLKTDDREKWRFWLDVRRAMIINRVHQPNVAASTSSLMTAAQ